MQGKDHVRLSGNHLYTHFGATGIQQAASSVKLDQDLSFVRTGLSVCLRYHHSGASITIDEFPSESLADTAQASVQRALRRFARRRQFADVGRRALLWIVLVGTVIMATLSLAILMRAATLTAPISYPAQHAYGAPAPLADGEILPAPPYAAPPAPTSSDPPRLAKALADGVATTRFSIPFSDGARGTLYVLSDPLCPHCRRLEPELDRLARDYTIHIFPVSVIGGQQSAGPVSALLCAQGPQRAVLWKKLIAGTLPLQTRCDAGSAALAANDRIFHALQLEGTPTIIDGAGRLVPDTIPNTAEAIGAWMRADAAR